MMRDAAEIIVGTVAHERLRPRPHRFNYPVFCLRLDLNRLDTLNNRWFGVDCWRPMAVYRRDYGPRDGSCLLSWVRQLLQDAGRPSDGPVHLQTFPRVFGYAFNPVSFWYCYGADGQLHSVLAEVNNTFGEHHLYLLQSEDGAAIHKHTTLQCRKVLHVSPFCQVEGHYRFRFRDGDTTRFSGIHYYDVQGLLMRTSISGHSQAFTSSNLCRNLMRQPMLTLGVMARIHWQALRLWMLKVPFYRKPAPPAETLSHGVSRLPTTDPHQELP